MVLRLFAACALASSVAHSEAARCPITSDTAVVWYGTTGDGGVGALSEQWMQHFWDWWVSYDSTLSVQKLGAKDITTNCELSKFSNLKLYTQPGGNAYLMQNTLGAVGKSNINRFLTNNGTYYGVCAGWYYASSDYYWQGVYYSWPHLLGRTPTGEGSITDLADYESKDPFAITRVSNGENAVYYGGPTRGWHQTPSSIPGKSTLTFEEVKGKDKKSLLSAWVTTELPRMLLTSAHMEAYEDIGIKGYMALDRQANYIWLAKQLNALMKTEYRIPKNSDPVHYV